MKREIVIVKVGDTPLELKYELLINYNGFYFIGNEFVPYFNGRHDLEYNTLYVKVAPNIKEMVIDEINKQVNYLLDKFRNSFENNSEDLEETLKELLEYDVISQEPNAYDGFDPFEILKDAFKILMFCYTEALIKRNETIRIN